MPTFVVGTGVAEDYVSLSFEVLNSDWFKSALLGALFELTNPENWIELGDVAVSLAVEEAARTIDSFIFTLSTFYTGLGDSVPDVIDSEDTGNLEIGAHFHVTTPGKIYGVRFYKSAANTGVHTGYLYNALCADLWSVVFTDETESGWQVALFDEPVSVNACEDYLVTYACPNGHYSKTEFGFSGGINAPPIVFPASVNGVYAYGDAPLCPSNIYNASNYFVDVIFKPTPI